MLQVNHEKVTHGYGALFVKQGNIIRYLGQIEKSMYERLSDLFTSFDLRDMKIIRKGKVTLLETFDDVFELV